MCLEFGGKSSGTCIRRVGRRHRWGNGRCSRNSGGGGGGHEKDERMREVGDYTSISEAREAASNMQTQPCRKPTGHVLKGDGGRWMGEVPTAREGNDGREGSSSDTST